MSERHKHWEQVYGTRAAEEVSWFEADPAPSRELILRACGPSDPVIDIGGGASRLVDTLLDAGFSDLTVLDISASALAASKARIGVRADQVTWLTTDITTWTPNRRYALWHDRAVFHFLTEEADRAAYVAAMRAALAPGGVAIVATFADDGPTRCSGLEIVRYSPEELALTFEALAPGWLRLEHSERVVHQTPQGREQRFQVSVFRQTEPTET